MESACGQRGEGRIGCIIWTLILAAGILVSAKVIPYQIALAEFKDDLKGVAQTMPRGTEQQFINFIYKTGTEKYDLPIDRKRIKVQKSKKRVVMDVEFTITLDFLVYTHTWPVSIHIDRDIFLI